MTKAIIKAYDMADVYRKRIFFFLVFVIVLSVASYCVNVFKIITTSSSIAKTEKKLTELNDSLRQIDKKYLSQVQKINEDDLARYNMTKGKVSMYIEKKVELGKLTSNNQGL